MRPRTRLVLVGSVLVVAAIVWAVANGWSIERRGRLEFEIGLAATLMTDSEVSVEHGQLDGTDCLFVTVEKLDSKTGMAGFTVKLDIRTEDAAHLGGLNFEWGADELRVRDRGPSNLKHSATYAYQRVDNHTYLVYAIGFDQSGGVGQCKRQLVCVRDRFAPQGAD